MNRVDTSLSMGIALIPVILLVAIALGLVFALRKSSGRTVRAQPYAGSSHLGWMPVLAAIFCVGIFSIPILYGNSWRFESDSSTRMRSYTTTSTSALAQPAEVHAAKVRKLAEHLRRQREITQELESRQRQLEAVNRQRDADRRQREQQQQQAKQALDKSWEAREASRKQEIDRLLQQIAQLTSESSKNVKQPLPAEAPDQVITASKTATTTAAAPPVTYPAWGGPSFAEGLIRIRTRSEQPPAWILPIGVNDDQHDVLRDWVRSVDRKHFAAPPNSEAIAVSSGWFATQEEAWKQVTERSLEIARVKLRNAWGSSADPKLISVRRLEDYMVRDCQLERTIKDFGNNIREPMYRGHVWLNIELTSTSPLMRYQAALAQERKLLQVGIGVVGVTLCLGLFGQCLRWNIRTEGRYRRRLLALATVTAGTIASGFMLFV